MTQLSPLQTVRVYKAESSEHRFDEHGKYLGFFILGEAVGYGAPFTEWVDWSEDKEKFLISLGFLTTLVGKGE